MVRHRGIDLCIRRVYLVKGATFCRLFDSSASPVKKHVMYYHKVSMMTCKISDFRDTIKISDSFL